VLSLVLAAAAPSGAAAQSAFDCFGDTSAGLPEPRKTDKRLTFGIYPGGAAGVIAGPRPDTVPEDQDKIDLRLAQLRAGRPFVVHHYSEYTTPAAVAAELARVAGVTRHYTSQGLLIEWVMRYRPAAAPDLPGYEDFVRRMVRLLAGNPRVKALQVTNEVNNRASPDASDGAYAGARDALVQGVIAADDEARRQGRPELEVGFNWFYRMDPGTEQEHWSEIGQKGGATFVAALDWIGLDAYPGTFFPPGGALPRSSSMANAMSVLRECLAPIAGIPKTTPIHVVENGWPTMPPARSYAEQELALREMVGAVHDYRANYNVTDYRWFDLRDADSAQPRFEQQYGITRSDYSPKPAFGTYADLVGRLGVQPAAAPALALCARPPRRARRRALGRARLGRRRAAVRRAFPTFSRARRQDRFCLEGGGRLRVGYARRRAVLALSSSRSTAVRGVRPGMRMRRRLRALGGRRAGGSRWFVAGRPRAARVWRARRGRVVEVGIADLRRGRRAFPALRRRR
jgi:hypothetical protein